ncbi:HEPN domain-containing protein [Facklamia miroungae]
MNTNTLLDKFEMDVYWKIDEVDIYGKLFYEIEKIYVEFPNADLEFDRKFPNLVGNSINKIISLVDCRVYQTKRGNNCFSKLSAKLMIIDSNPYFSIEEVAFNEIYFSFNYLPAFINKKAIKYEDGSFIKSTEIEQKIICIKTIQAKLKEHISPRISSKITLSEGLVNRLSTDYAYKLIYDELKLWKNIKKDLDMLKQLFTLFFGFSISYSYFYFLSDSKDLLGKRVPSIGRIYFPQSVKTISMNYPHTNYNYDLLLENIENIVNTYYENYEDLKTSILNMNANIDFKNLVETQYFDAITSLESFHNKYMVSNRKLNEDFSKNYEGLKKFIKDNFNEPDSKRLFSSLSHIKEKNFKEKIVDILKNIPNELTDLIDFSSFNYEEDNIGNFINDCKKTRNHHAHGNYDDKPGVFKGELLLKATKILNIINEYNLMNKINVPNDVIISGILANKNYSNVLNRKNKFL